MKPETGQDMPPWMLHALKDKGLKERIGPATNPRIAEFFSHTGLGGYTPDSVPWCSAAMNACCVQSVTEKAVISDELARSG